MGLRSTLAWLSVISVFSLAACSKDAAQKVQPETRGKRGENCQARNDCEAGLACLSGICALNEFNVSVSAKHCDRVECSTDKDCCGDRATSAPSKCKNRDQICNPANARLKNCTVAACQSDAECTGGATCPMGTCQNTKPGLTCQTTADCKKDACVVPVGQTQGTCTVSAGPCTPATEQFDCLYYFNTPSCSLRACDCKNPLYLPESPVCTDTDCDDVCLLRCSEDSLCLQDKSCKTDDECIAAGLKTCDGSRCVECTVDKDCNVKDNETCDSGICHKPCEFNEECGLFEACTKGDCVYVGCQSDRECILAAARGSAANGTGGSGNLPKVSSGSDDPRLYKCLPSEQDPKVNTCKIPCENDGSCGQFEACDNGYCKFVGCETADECRAYLGISNQMTSDTKPYVATAVCRE